MRVGGSPCSQRTADSSAMNTRKYGTACTHTTDSQFLSSAVQCAACLRQIIRHLTRLLEGGLTGRLQVEQRTQAEQRARQPGTKRSVGSHLFGGWARLSRAFVGVA